MNSFRLKLAWLSGLVTVALLLGFGFVLWQLTYRFSVGQLDRELRSLGQANLERVQGVEHWLRLEEALRFVSGGRDSPGFVLWVRNYDKVIYQSPGWPQGLVPESVPRLDRYEGSSGPRPGEPLPPPPRRGEELSPRNPPLPLKTPRFFTYRADGRAWRFGAMGNPYVTLMLGTDLSDLNARMGDLRAAYMAVMLVAPFLAAGVAWLVARRALQPVMTLTQTAERVTARGLSQRIPAMTRDREFNRLITVFNEMLDRLQTSFEQATRFSADASHELKTPLARLQLELEQALEAARPDSPEEAVYSSLVEEVGRLKSIVQRLLLLSLADAGRLALQRVPVDLTGLMENLVEDVRIQSPHLSLDTLIAPGVQVNADSQLLEQALQNLVSNAAKYSSADGRLRLELEPEASRLVVRVSNTGPGIPPADRERIFERFYRADKARSQKVEGVGLGLSLAREILRAHGGDVLLEASEPPWTTFLAWLPTAKPPSAPPDPAAATPETTRRATSGTT